MKRIKILKHTLTIVLILATLFSLTACKAQTKNENETAVTFTDALGRKVSIPKKPERVAALLGSFADVWMLAGGTLCAAAEDAWEDFGLESPDCTNLGGAHSPNLELLIASDPDLVIASASTASNVEMKEALEVMGITVVYFDVDNFEDYLYMLNICTDLTERKDLYEQNGLALKAQIDAVKAQYAESDIPDAVWEQAREGLPIEAAYALYERQEALRKAAAEQVNRKNAGNSWGKTEDATNGFLSPDEVRGMSREEVRRNYDRILTSMKHWN